MKKTLPMMVVVVATLLIVSMLVVVPEHGVSSKQRFVVDMDDYDSFSSECSGRAAFSSYDARCSLFMSKALADDDRDGDGVSTLNSCLSYILSAYPGLSVPEAILRFVSSEISYMSDDDLYDSFDWAAYPVETLVSGAGDCEDVAILAASLLYRAGYSSGILLFKDHAVAMVAADCSLVCEGDLFHLVLDKGGLTYACLDATYDCPLGYTCGQYSCSDIMSFDTARP